MTFLEGVLHFASIFSAAIVAGGQVYVLMVIVPTKRRFEAPASVMVHNAMLGHQTDRFMKPAGIVSILAAFALLALRLANVVMLKPPAVAALIVGILGTIGVVLTSRYFNVKTNAHMLGWSLDAIPEDYPAIRSRWDLVHTIRASCGVLSLVGFLVAGLIG